MINLATGLCVAIKGRYVATGVHAGDHFQYPDCRPEFIFKTEDALRTANEGFLPPIWELRAPWLHVTKDQIVSIAWEIFHDGDKFNKVMGNTWSCYKGDEKHCGKCGTCVERAEAFFLAGLADPTEYEDSEYWKAVSKSPKLIKQHRP
jgi:7-cyano-7-deazaguanine synthase